MLISVPVATLSGLEFMPSRVCVVIRSKKSDTYVFFFETADIKAEEASRWI